MSSCFSNTEGSANKGKNSLVIAPSQLQLIHITGVLKTPADSELNLTTFALHLMDSKMDKLPIKADALLDDSDRVMNPAFTQCAITSQSGVESF